MRSILSVLTICALFVACAESPAPLTAADAGQFARSVMIVDGHVDLPYALKDSDYDPAVASGQGDFDYPRAMQGGLSTPFMSIYTPASLDGTPEATTHAREMIALVENIASTNPDKFRVVRSVAEARQAFDDGLIGLPLGMENGSPIQTDMGLLEEFHQRGIRYITLAHSKSNALSDSSYDDNRQWGGLSDFGKKVVARMNELGIMIDISHLSDDAAWQVLELSRAPVIASHSSARHFTPGLERNMSDDMIRELDRRDGVIMINFGTYFLTAEGVEYTDKRGDAYDAYLERNGFEHSSELSRAFREDYLLTHPYPYAELDDVLDHIDHVVDIASIDAVGVGSDYDGVGDSLPTGLKDASEYPNLVAGLIERGYDRRDIEKILSGNVLRVWSEVEALAERSK